MWVAVVPEPPLPKMKTNRSFSQASNTRSAQRAAEPIDPP